MLNWAVARGTVPIPRSSNIEHVVENTKIYDFKLTDEEMATVSAFDKNFRFSDRGDNYEFIWRSLLFK